MTLVIWLLFISSSIVFQSVVVWADVFQMSCHRKYLFVMDNYNYHTIMQNERPGVGKRLASMLLDHFITCFILMLPVFAILFLASNPNEDRPMMAPGFQFVFLGLMFLYFFKDSFGARSIAKRMTKLQIVDNSTGKAASVMQCFFRNLTIVIWPVEVIMTLFNSQRRIGDFIAGTKVVNYGTSQRPAFEFE